MARSLSRALDDGEIEVRYNPAADEEIVCLTALGASRAGVRLNDESTAWEYLGGCRVRPRARRDDGPDFRRIPDPAPGPLDRLIALEADAVNPGPAPLYFLGVTLPIPLPREGYPPSACPAHPGRRPGRLDYCLYCRPDVLPPRPRAVRLPR